MSGYAANLKLDTPDADGYVVSNYLLTSYREEH